MLTHHPWHMALLSLDMWTPQIYHFPIPITRFSMACVHTFGWHMTYSRFTSWLPLCSKASLLFMSCHCSMYFNHFSTWFISFMVWMDRWSTSTPPLICLALDYAGYATSLFIHHPLIPPLDLTCHVTLFLVQSCDTFSTHLTFCYACANLLLGCDNISKL